MLLNLEQIIKQIDCEVVAPQGNNLCFDDVFEGVAPLNLAQKPHISFLVNEKYIDDALVSKAGAILCDKKTSEIIFSKVTGLLLICENPYAAFAKVSQNFFKPSHPFSGISPQSYIDKTAKIHPSATIFPFVFIGPDVEVGENSVLYSGCFVGASSTIGADCILYPNVVVREGCHIADRCLFNPGVVIGGDGFGFAPTQKENIKIPQIGGVEIGNDVEIGSNATIDRGAMADTKIGSQTKIDNLVMVAHNVVIGEMCFIAAQAGIAGSTVIGNYCMLGGQAGIGGHIKIADNVSVTAQTGISKSITSSAIWQGTPAKPQKEFAKHHAILNRFVKEKLNGK